jgi:serine/threonine protein phosphatase PrpC
MGIESAAGATDRGPGRVVNEDAILVRAEDGLLAVADGMGGPGAGDVAARIAVKRLESALRVAPTLHLYRESLAAGRGQLK